MEGSRHCRGFFGDLDATQREAVARRCVDEKFSRAMMMLPNSVFDAIFEQSIKPILPADVDQKEAEQKLCNMESVVEHDRKIVEHSGATYAQLGDALKTVMRLAVHKSDVHDGGAVSRFLSQLVGGGETARPPFETPYEKLLICPSDWSDQGSFESTFSFNGHVLRVFVILWGGAQECPFQNHDEDKSYHGYRYGARDVVVTNLTTGSPPLVYSSLLPHMIKHHGFFEGPLCHYRVEPSRILEVLGPFEQNKSYRIMSTTEMPEKRKVYRWEDWVNWLPKKEEDADTIDDYFKPVVGVCPPLGGCSSSSMSKTKSAVTEMESETFDEYAKPVVGVRPPLGGCSSTKTEKTGKTESERSEETE